MLVKTCLIALLLMVTVGCYRVLDPSGHHYVYDIGDPEEITEWALSQDQEQHIEAAQIALANLANPKSQRAGDLASQEAAMEGFIQVHRKLVQGWPNFKPDYGPWATSEDRASISVEERILNMIKADYRVIAEEAQVNPLAHSAFYQLKPPADRGDLLEYWQEQRHRYGLEEPTQ